MKNQIFPKNQISCNVQYSNLTRYLQVESEFDTIAFQINILAERPDRFFPPVRSENFYFSEKLYVHIFSGKIKKLYSPEGTFCQANRHILLITKINQNNRKIKINKNQMLRELCA